MRDSIIFNRRRHDRDNSTKAKKMVKTTEKTTDFDDVLDVDDVTPIETRRR